VEAHVGDKIVVRSTHQGEAERTGEIVECAEPGGGPPYLVRWSDGHTGLFYPAGPVTVVSPRETSRG
jgi:hypothetical protein